ncbi:hypothetical protein COY52_11220 [Candidatus Desantisbacteria bacterium CG_4_10_14_0_8_um_filter_48_22]|uniref:LPS-assembly protein LptD n=1 Tax=Candidatus Desantisbacteria bacterium CG_4_10_14_0_8_um_filter_48_22 TaxID=1974543 RepID=A0A2M7S5Y7_9BACT|nr:MAG: hypothetical protein AUJ67_02710 [Candidatus Desantisbacteria bacterium CG1_02_49_89]PIV55353.1 MAG: hypothetical protein COS16_07410 [Candidatus Desantisbacteria bacterium CG02_land_8_20_14_3_00_49_13]PIZ14733.1 MAG: hypothetical protein COY52_11220 [Candidatus Desantisbacteria bacterium CG_4_10_14_0_8_um_filter_48_22]
MHPSKISHLLFTAFSLIFFIPAEFLFAAVETGPAPGDTGTTPIYCESDYLEYNKGKGIVEGWGKVGVRYKDVEIYSDYLRVNVESEEILASGNISFMSRSGKIEGDSVAYGIKSERGIVQNASTSFQPLFYRGKKIEKLSDKELTVSNGLCTTCDLPEPHYSLRASRISIYPEDSIVAFNVGLFLGSVPVFYIPVFTFPLKKGRISWLIPTVGYSADKGWYVQAGYNYSIRSALYGNVFGEYMEKKGFGLGSEFEYSANRYEGASSIYYVRDRDTDRYKADLKLRPEKGSSFIYVYLLSDMGFDREFGPYFGPPLNWVRRKSTAYVCYNTPLGRYLNFQMDIKREDSKEAVQTSLPVLGLYSSPVRLWSMPLYADFSTKTGNYYTNYDNYVFSDNWLNVTPEQLKLTDSLGLVSGVGVQGAYHNRDRFLPGYRAKIGPRYRMRKGYFLTEATYNIESIVEGDTSVVSPAASQYVRGFIIYTDRITSIELSGNYDLLSQEYIWDRFKRARLDIMVNPAGRLRFFSSTKYHVYKNTSQNISYIEWINDIMNVKLGTQYYYGNYMQLSLTSELNFPGIKTFLGKYQLTVSSSFDLMNNRFDVVDLIIARDLHCWDVSLTYRALSQEIWLQAGLKAFPGMSVQFHPSIF